MNLTFIRRAEFQSPCGRGPHLHRGVFLTLLGAGFRELGCGLARAWDSVHPVPKGRGSSWPLGFNGISGERTPDEGASGPAAVRGLWGARQAQGSPARLLWGSRQPALPKACALSRPCCRSQHPSHTQLEVFLWSLPSWGRLGGLR